jgi:hypothetical protein
MTNFLNHQFCLDEGDRAKITCDVDKVVRHLAARALLFRRGLFFDIAIKGETNYISHLMYQMRVTLL